MPVENFMGNPQVSEINGKQLVLHEDGIYIGMSDDEYFSDPALGSTDIKNLLISPPDYWHNSLYNPQRPESSTRYQDRGHGLETCLLYGETQFREHFARKLLKEDHPAALFTMDDIKRELTRLGLKVSGTKAEIGARLKDALPSALIFDDLVTALEAQGKTILDAEDYDRILIADQMIRRNPVLANVFRNGVPQVAMFWTRDGVRCRAKFDYLSIPSTIDLKGFSNSRELPVDKAIESAFVKYGHHLQASHYMDARSHLSRFLDEDRVFGGIDRDWLRRVADTGEDSFCLVYHQLSGATVTRAKIVRRGGYVDGWASTLITSALEIWRENWNLFGSGLWVDMSGISEITEEDIPGWVR